MNNNMNNNNNNQNMNNNIDFGFGGDPFEITFGKKAEPNQFQRPKGYTVTVSTFINYI